MHGLPSKKGINSGVLTVESVHLLTLAEIKDPVVAWEDCLLVLWVVSARIDDRPEFQVHH